MSMSMGRLRTNHNIWPRRLLRASVSFVKQPPWVPHGHYYSPLTSRLDVERAVRAVEVDPPVVGVDLREDEELRLVGTLAPMWGELPRSRRWNDGPANNQFGLADAALYSSILRTFRPGRVIEVGSGYSSAVALDARDEFGIDIALTFIEPYPERLERLLTDGDRGGPAAVKVRREPVQDTPLSVFSSLGDGDVLFIDSTHVAKAGSDVLHLVDHVLPRLPAGVLVHFHDMFWPWEYPASWLQEHRDWNELYLVHSLLRSNPDWSVVLFADWLWQVHPEVVAAHLPAAATARPGSLWLRKR